MESIVSVRPEAYFFPVHIYPCFAHSAVELQGNDLFFGLEVFHIKKSTVPTDSHIRKAACAPCFYCRHPLPVLYNSYFLKVMFTIERAIYSPIVGNDNRLPVFIIE